VALRGVNVCGVNVAVREVVAELGCGIVRRTVRWYDKQQAQACAGIAMLPWVFTWLLRSDRHGLVVESNPWQGAVSVSVERKPTWCQPDDHANVAGRG
jgi:hypothetical protein